jgi:hypothetical protein
VTCVTYAACNHSNAVKYIVIFYIAHWALSWSVTGGCNMLIYSTHRLMYITEHTTGNC